MDRLTAMAVYAAVCDANSFAGAARRLGLSPPAVTRTVVALESHLGVRLLQRTTRSLHLTEAGRITLGYADRIFETGAELVATLTEGSRPDRSVLRIGAVATLSRNFQESFVRPLLARRDIDACVIGLLLGARGWRDHSGSDARAKAVD